MKEGGVGRTYSRRERDELCKEILVGNRERKRPRGKTRCGWKDNIKIDLKEIV
jgi:hypothetical protein